MFVDGGVVEAEDVGIVVERVRRGFWGIRCRISTKTEASSRRW